METHLMKTQFTICAVLLLGYVAVGLHVRASDCTSQVNGAQTLASVPLAFTQNIGQWPDSIRYRAYAGGATMWFTQGGAYYQFTRRAARGGSQTLEGTDRLGGRPDNAETVMIKAIFVGANPAPRMTGGEILEYKCNYFIGDDPTRWRTDVPNYDAVVYEEVYPGIDLKYYGGSKAMEYDFVVSPEADPSQIAVRYEGVRSVRVDEDGRLVVRTRWGEVTEQQPIIYQLVDGERRLVEGEYVLQADNTFGFALAANYDRSLAVVIDPVLSYSTYLGGTGDDYGDEIAIDSSGNTFVAGSTMSANFPILNPFQATYGGGYFDAFVTKFNSSGNAMLYSTYLGGSKEDFGWGIAVDSSGSVYLTGETFSANFPVHDAYQSTFGGGTCDAYVAKLNSSGNALVYSTYLGGSVEDYSCDIAIDGRSNVYITGSTSSANFPVHDACQVVYGGGSFDAFVAKLDSSGNALQYSSYLGGSGSEWGRGIAVDADGDAYITGYTSSTDFPTQNAYQAVYGGGANDVFVAKFASTGSTLLFSTYLGGTLDDSGWGIAVDSSGNAHISGKTGSTDFPVQNAYQFGYGGGTNDAFVAKFNVSGDALLFSTYLGGSGDDQSSDIALDDSGNAQVTGVTNSADFPTQNAYQTAFGGGANDAFVTAFNSSGNTLLYSTYLGGSAIDYAYGIAVDHVGDVFLTGYTQSANFPTHDPYQATRRGGYDAFVTKLDMGCCGGRVGDANGSGEDEPTIADVSVLIDATFITGTCDGILNCMAEADINQSGGANPICDDVTIGDISILIDYLFITGSSLGLPGCL